MTKRELTYSEAIREAIDQKMESDPDVFIMGEGVPDPKGIFGTTLGLKEKYGENRVFDMPVSENAVTGVLIGAAITGMRPIMTHQRMDFMICSMDQIINNAAKWRYMFGGQTIMPLVIRTIIGRGWGQGAQHSQNLQALFAGIPGLKVLMPSTAYDAKGLLISAIEDNNPVIFIEHRWLHATKSYVPEEEYRVPMDKARVVKKGKDITIASYSYMLLEVLKAESCFGSEIDAEILDLRTLNPLDKQTVFESVKKTGRIMVVESAWKTLGIGAELVSAVAENREISLNAHPVRIGLPDLPTPTSRALTRYYYPGITDIVEAAAGMKGLDGDTKRLLLKKAEAEKESQPMHDVPDKTFTGPF